MFSKLLIAITLLITSSINASPQMLSSDLLSPDSAIVVNTLVDELNADGDCSLREAITVANTNQSVDSCPAGSNSDTDTITFSVSGTIVLVSTLPAIANAGALIIDGGETISISGNDIARVFYVQNEAELSLLNLSVTNGNGGEDFGGGLFSDGGSITVDNCTFSNNYSRSGGGLAARGDSGDVMITNSTFINNSARQGGAIHNRVDMYILDSIITQNTATSSPGGIDNFGNMRIVSSEISHNSASSEYGTGGGISNGSQQLHIHNSLITNNNIDGFGGGVDNAFGEVYISTSTFVENSAKSGGAINNYDGTYIITGSTFLSNEAEHGGAIDNSESGKITITNSTFTSNSSTKFGGAIKQGGLRIEISNCTFYKNTSDDSGGTIRAFSGGITVENSIIYRDESNPSAENCYTDGRLYDYGHNIDSGSTCDFDPAKGSMNDTDPLLAQLEDNGGPTQTHALLEDSPAIDSGDPDGCADPRTDGETLVYDQRGYWRTFDGDGENGPICDRGAYEYGSEVPLSIYLPLLQNGN